MAITGRKDALGPVWMVAEHYQVIEDLLKDYDEHSTILEVGTYLGRSAIHMLTCNPKITVHCLDHWPDPAVYASFQRNIAPFKNRVRPIKDKSNHAANHFKAVDFVYLDADHHYEHVYNDLKNIRRIVKGFVLGDDWQKAEVRKAVAKLLNRYELVWSKEYTYLLKPIG